MKCKVCGNTSDNVQLYSRYDAHLCGGCVEKLDLRARFISEYVHPVYQVRLPIQGMLDVVGHGSRVLEEAING